MATGNSTNLVSVDYEIFGKVQGVFFRKFTSQNILRSNHREYFLRKRSKTIITQFVSCPVQSCCMILFKNVL